MKIVSAAKSTLLEIAGYPSLIHYRPSPPHRLPNGQPGCGGLKVRSLTTVTVCARAAANTLDDRLLSVKRARWCVGLQLCADSSHEVLSKCPLQLGYWNLTCVLLQVCSGAADVSARQHAAPHANDCRRECWLELLPASQETEVPHESSRLDGEQSDAQPETSELRFGVLGGTMKSDRKERESTARQTTRGDGRRGVGRSQHTCTIESGITENWAPQILPVDQFYL